MCPLSEEDAAPILGDWFHASGCIPVSTMAKELRRLLGAVRDLESYARGTEDRFSRIIATATTAKEGT